MTRINAGLDPAELPNVVLLAEHRELIRIPRTVASGRAVVRQLPPTFRMGTGHVKFFYDKLGYLGRRYEALYRECVARGFAVQYRGEIFRTLATTHPKLCGPWVPCAAARPLLLARFAEKGHILKIISGDALQEPITPV